MLPGDDHALVGDTDRLYDEIEEFFDRHTANCSGQSRAEANSTVTRRNGPWAVISELLDSAPRQGAPLQGALYLSKAIGC